MEKIEIRVVIGKEKNGKIRTEKEINVAAHFCTG